MKNLFVITTPFQLLGALEAIDYLNLDDNILVVIDNNLEKNTEQLTSLLEKNSKFFSVIIRHGGNKKSKFFKNILLIKKLIKINFNNVLIGDLGSIQKIIISNIKSKKVYLLDDGAKTILIYNDFNKGKDFFKRGFRQIRYMLFGLKTFSSNKIKIFTFFNLLSNSKVEVINHDFEYFKEVYKLKEKKIESKIFILGQPIVENSRVSKESYESYLNSLINRYKDCEIYYLMHRREEKTNLEFYSLNRSLNIIESSVPGEIFFSQMDYKPKAIIGINTTLLFSLKKIFNDLDILSFKFEDKDILKSKNWFDESVQYFEENEIEIINKG